MEWGRWTRVCEDCRCEVTEPEEFIDHATTTHAGRMPATFWRRHRRTRDEERSAA